MNSSHAELAIVFPSYGHFDYLERAVASGLEKSSLLAHAIIVDDASEDFAGFLRVCHRLRARFPGRTSEMLFPANGGMTRSWNQGLRMAKELEARYACVTNNDVIFSQGWDVPVVEALKSHRLVGPLTNAPGTEDRQTAERHLPGVLDGLCDDPAWIDEAGSRLRQKFGDETLANPLNGFCLVARTDSWWEGAYDSENVFRPVNEFGSSGVRNPTPLMTLQEYELQTRWRNQPKDWSSAIVLGSFVFHYRSVSRGPDYLRGKWFRPPEASDAEAPAAV